jgi:hypothetical protein
MLKYYRETENSLIVDKVLEDGSYSEISANAPEVLAWLAEGNTLANSMPVLSKEEDEARLAALLGNSHTPGHNPSGLYPAELPNI